MGFVTGMLAGMPRHGKDAAPLLARAGIDLADTASRIPVERYAVLYNLCIDALADEAVQRALSGQTVRKVIVRAPKLVNIVV